MAIENFIPTIWSAKLLVRLRKALVYGNLTNQDYEGEIKNAGDTVKINEIGPITVSDYTKNSEITWAALTDAQKVLQIDQQKSFSFYIDDIDTAQQKPKLMAAATDEAAYAIADTIDQHIAGLYTAAGTTSNLGTTASPINISSGNVIDYIFQVGKELDENNVPRGQRWMVVTPWFQMKMGLAEVDLSYDTGIVGNGYIGRNFGFNFYTSNNVANSSTTWYAVTAGTNQAMTYAGQLTKVKMVDIEDRFAEGVKGLYVYGSKVVRPNALALLYCDEGTG